MQVMTVEICTKLTFVYLFLFENYLSIKRKAAFKTKINTILIYAFLKYIL